VREAEITAGQSYQPPLGRLDVADKPIIHRAPPPATPPGDGGQPQEGRRRRK